MKSKKLISVCLLLSVLMVGCQSKETPEDTTTNGSQTEQTEKISGSVVGERLNDPTGKKGDVVVTTVEFKDGEPVDVDIDVRQESGTMKKAASKDGKYVMREGEEKAWHEQVELLENFLKENNFDTTKVTLGENGDTDAISGVSIKVDAYVEGVKEVIDAVENGTELPEGFTGAKTVETPYDASGEKKDMVIAKVVFDHNKPVSVSIDVKLEDGTMKKKLSQDGGYVMKEGEEKAWHEQIEELEKFIVENDFDLAKITLDDNGATDAVSGVSIKIGGYLEAVQKALDEVK